MSTAIYVIPDGAQAVRLVSEGYSREEDLQQLLQEHPDLLGGDQIDREAPRRWLLIGREASVPSQADGGDRWRLDHLFLDQDAIPTLVEVKRKNDTRLRREVVGQMLDYAANATRYWPGDTMRVRFADSCAAAGEDPDEMLTEFLNEDADPERFWATAYENLRSGKIRLVFVADEIPPELQRIVEFLNERMSPTEVLAVEIQRFAGGGFQTHIPRVIGQTAEAQEKKRPSRGRNVYPVRQLDDERYIAQVQEYGGKGLATNIATLVRWIRGRPELSAVVEQKSYMVHRSRFVGGGSNPPVFLYLWAPGPAERADRLFPGRVEFAFHRIAPFNQPETHAELMARIQAIPGDTRPTAERAKPGVSLPMTVFADLQTLSQLMETLDWAIERIIAATCKQP